MKPKKILVLGSSGMLGHTVFARCKPLFETFELNREDLDAADLNSEGVNKILKINPHVIINCMGIIKQLKEGPELSYAVNSVFPHKLNAICSQNGIRLIHISTDCVFAGSKGMYTEKDTLTSVDTYGLSKRLGEVDYSPNAVTLRTSIIGHEASGKNLSLLDWFLSQKGSVNGFSKAVFSGFPTVELADIIIKYVIPNPYLTGLYNVSAEPIDKYTLLNLIKETYKFDIEIKKEEEFVIDRSLDSSKFRSETGYAPPSWSDLIKKMYMCKTL